jgi:hypothetical protein
MNDRDVIDAFVAYLEKQGHPGLQVDRRPEDENRDSSDIDAIAGVFAIEHTSIDTLPNQRRDSDWFVRATGGLEQQFPSKPSFRLNVTLKYDAVTKGQDWAAIRQRLKSWVINEAPRLADGRNVLDDIPGVPFRLHVRKASDRRPGVFFARFEPDDNTLPDRIREQFDRKAKKLGKYHGPGKTTVLLVEDDDIALMNEWKMLDAIRAAYPDGPPPAVDEIWYAETSIPSEIEFRDFTSDLWQEHRPTSQCNGRGERPPRR